MKTLSLATHAPILRETTRRPLGHHRSSIPLKSLAVNVNCVGISRCTTSHRVHPLKIDGLWLPMVVDFRRLNGHSVRSGTLSLAELSPSRLSSNVRAHRGTSLCCSSLSEPQHFFSPVTSSRRQFAPSSPRPHCTTRTGPGPWSSIQETCMAGPSTATTPMLPAPILHAPWSPARRHHRWAMVVPN